MKTLINILKSFTGIAIFYGVQILAAIVLTSTNINNNILYIGMEIATVLLLIYINFDKIKKDFKDFDDNYKEYLKLAIKAYFIGLFIMILSNLIINQYILVDNIAHNEEVDRLIIFKYPLFSVIGMIITGPFIEEVAFRLGFKRYINNRFIYYILATLIFAGVHVFNGISNPLELLYFIPYGSLSLVFAYILDKTDNIFTSTIIHLCHNTIAILLVLSVYLIGV